MSAECADEFLNHLNLWDELQDRDDDFLVDVIH